MKIKIEFDILDAVKKSHCGFRHHPRWRGGGLREKDKTNYITNSKMKAIIKNYNNQNIKIKSLVKETFITSKNSLIFIINESCIDKTICHTGVYLLKPNVKLNFSGKGILVSISDAQDFDIHGYFPPRVNNSNKNDKLYNSRHTIIFSNTIFRKTGFKKIKQLKKVNALSQHLKAELVELFSSSSQVPPHCHGKAILSKEFKEKFKDEFSLKTINENYAHPQIIVVLEGDGRIYLDLERHNINVGDVIVYGANTIHGSKASHQGLKFIHFSWKIKI